MDTKEQILYLKKININKLGLTSLQNHYENYKRHSFKTEN